MREESAVEGVDYASHIADKMLYYLNVMNKEPIPTGAGSSLVWKYVSC